MRPVIVISALESVLDARPLCECKNIKVLRSVHGKPGDENIPFDLAEEIVTVAPQCSSLDINDMGCSRFDSSNEALQHARELSRSLATSGYTGEVTISGSQNITLAILKQDEWKLKILSIFDKHGIVDATKKVICDQNNTLKFKVCAQNVMLALPPCQPAGSMSILHKGKKATTTIVCQQDGKRANQSCTYQDPESGETDLCRWGDPVMCS